MKGGKEYFLIMREELFNEELNPMQRSMFSHCELRECNEYETHKNDEYYVKLKKVEKKAKKDVQEYLFNKRNK